MKNASANTHKTKPIARYKSSCFPPGLGGTRYLVFVFFFVVVVKGVKVIFSKSIKVLPVLLLLVLLWVFVTKWHYPIYS